MSVPAPVLYHIGLALEAGMSREEMLQTWGQPTLDWLDEAERDPEFKRFIREMNERFPSLPIKDGRYVNPDGGAVDVGERNRQQVEWQANWR